MRFGCGLVLVTALSLHAAPAPALLVRIVDKQGRTRAQWSAGGPAAVVDARSRRPFRPGDRVVVKGPKQLWVQIGRMKRARVYCPAGEWEFPIPFGAAARAYPSFAGRRLRIYAAAVTPRDLARLGALAANPYDRRDARGVYPHAEANSVCRGEPVFAARNAIDGETRGKGHGAWPHQSWGPDMRDGLWIRIDFGRDIELHSIDVWLRGDTPHDGFFQSAAAVFSDGATLPLRFQARPGKQVFRLPAPRRVRWLKLTDFRLPASRKWCAITEIDAWGRDASDYVKKASWRDTLISQWRLGPAYVVERARLDFPAQRQQLEIIADWIAQDHPSAEADAHAYLRGCERRRRARLAPYRDALAHIVFTKHFDMGGSHYAYTEALSDAQHERHFRPGSSLCVLDMNGVYARVRTLLADPGGVIRDPCVSWDGRRIVFAWKKSALKDDYHLYELRLADGRVRQLTRGLGFADYEPAYLPNGDLIFSSTRCVQTVDCWWTEVSNLFTCDPDGRCIRRLGYDQVHTNYPTVAPDGRVLYTRWEYSDRGQIYPQGLFQMNPDGTGQTEVYGNNSWFPTTILHARQIPGSRKIVCVFSGHHTRQQGWLGLIDPGFGRQENAGAQLIAPRRATPAARVDRYGQTGDLFQYPWPLSETAFLCALKPAGAPHFALYWVAADGSRELLVSDPRISCNQPMPLAPRPRPHVRPCLRDDRRRTAVIYMQDVYAGPGLRGVRRGVIKSLRVVRLHYRRAGVGYNSNHGPAGGALVSTPISIQGSWDVKSVLGDARVYEDGSACFVVPARAPLYFQALDAKGQAVQTMRSWVTLMPGENISCVGCHEDKNAAPPQLRATQAMRAGPQPLAHADGPPRPFGFVREIQPILDKHCVRCHYLDAPPPASGRVSGRRFDPKTMRVVAGCKGATWRYTTRPCRPDWFQPGFDDSGWRVGVGGFGRRGTPGARVATPWRGSDIWIRRVFHIAADAMPTNPALLIHHDEDVEAYINGALAAAEGGYTVRYEVRPLSAAARAALRPGRNVLAAHCRQTVGGQFIDVGLVDLGGRPAPARPKRLAAFSLKGVQRLDPRSLRKWSDSYKALANPRWVSWISPQSVPSMLPPYHAGACRSPLLSMLDRGHNGVKLSAAERRKIALWIDLLVPYCASYTEGLEGKALAKYRRFERKYQRWHREEEAGIAAEIQGSERK